MSYAKIELSLVVSDYDDFSSPYIDARPKPGSAVLMPTETMVQRQLMATTPGTTIEADQLGIASYFVLVNEDTLNFVTFTYTRVATGTNSVRVGPGKFAVIPDLDGTTDMTVIADTAACYCRIYGIGA